MTLLAASSAALAAGALPAAVAAPARPTLPHVPPARPKLSAAALEDLRMQKESTRKAVEKIRAYPLPFGTDPAFVFRPIKAARGRRG
jgi:transcriptional regulator with AAA-type ATPase domain